MVQVPLKKHLWQRDVAAFGGESEYRAHRLGDKSRASAECLG